MTSLKSFKRLWIVTIIVMILLSMIVFKGKAQSTKDVVIYASELISGSADGVNQALAYHHLGQGNKFWDYTTSWKNKYKDFDHGDKRAAFFGSKTILVAATDGNHLTRLVDRSFQITALTVALMEKNKWKQVVKKIIISSLINRVGFVLFYNIIYK